MEELSKKPQQHVWEVCCCLCMRFVCTRMEAWHAGVVCGLTTLFQLICLNLVSHPLCVQIIRLVEQDSSAHEGSASYEAVFSLVSHSFVC